jgi:hypothetical protein
MKQCLLLEFTRNLQKFIENATFKCHSERSFSKMNLIKTDIRSSLKECHLNDLLMISLNGPMPENFNP